MMPAHSKLGALAARTELQLCKLRMQSTGARPVLHIDVDTFFCQVEQNLHPSLKGKAFAIQQHQDIIAVNYAARAAGVKKHMGPKEARTLLSKVGGIVHHVHMEAGGRVSYKPYRDVSKVLISRLRQFAGVGIIEKASIDEVYILFKLDSGPPLHGAMAAMQHAAQLAGTIRQAVLQELSLVVSVGIASNKMLAKLASQAIKPDGILVIDGEPAMQKLLKMTPASRLPRCGGKVTDTLTLAGIYTVADLQAWSAQQLQQDLGFAADQAEQLSEWSHGFDASPVAERPPPKTLSIQMTLTPIPLVMHPSMGRDIAVAGGKAGLLEPLPIGAANFRERLDGLLLAMGADILGRVMGDKMEEDRWPQKFELQMRAFRNSDRKSKTAVRSCSFPSPALLAAADPSAGFNAETGSGSKLEAALVANAVKLSKGAAAGLPETWNLVQVEMTATNFSSYAAAAAPSIHKFLQHSTSRPLPSAGQHIHTQADEQQQSPAACVTDETVDTARCLERQQSVTQSSEALRQRESWLQAPQQLQYEAERDCMADEVGQIAAIQCSDVGGHLQDSSMYHGVDIEQQRQMLREIELWHSSARQRNLSQLGMKRTHANQQSKLGVKQSKSEHTTGPGQQTITSLFGKVP
ncbi:TPA: hypothetical protein ACH3X1_008741 [Trebouxia sp. C0004]